MSRANEIGHLLALLGDTKLVRDTVNAPQFRNVKFATFQNLSLLLLSHLQARTPASDHPQKSEASHYGESLLSLAKQAQDSTAKPSQSDLKRRQESEELASHSQTSQEQLHSGALDTKPGAPSAQPEFVELPGQTKAGNEGEQSSDGSQDDSSTSHGTASHSKQEQQAQALEKANTTPKRALRPHLPSTPVPETPEDADAAQALMSFQFKPRNAPSEPSPSKLYQATVESASPSDDGSAESSPAPSTQESNSDAGTASVSSTDNSEELDDASSVSREPSLPPRAAASQAAKTSTRTVAPAKPTEPSKQTSKSVPPQPTKKVGGRPRKYIAPASRGAPGATKQQAQATSGIKTNESTPQKDSALAKNAASLQATDTKPGSLKRAAEEDIQAARRKSRYSAVKHGEGLSTTGYDPFKRFYKSADEFELPSFLEQYMKTKTEHNNPALAFMDPPQKSGPQPTLRVRESDALETELPGVVREQQGREPQQQDTPPATASEASAQSADNDITDKLASRLRYALDLDQRLDADTVRVLFVYLFFYDFVKLFQPDGGAPKTYEVQARLRHFVNQIKERLPELFEIIIVPPAFTRRKRNKTGSSQGKRRGPQNPEEDPIDTVIESIKYYRLLGDKINFLVGEFGAGCLFHLCKDLSRWWIDQAFAYQGFHAGNAYTYLKEEIKLGDMCEDSGANKLGDAIREEMMSGLREAIEKTPQVSKKELETIEGRKFPRLRNRGKFGVPAVAAQA